MTASGATGTNAATYINTVTGTDSNYNLTLVNGSLVIGKAGLVVGAHVGSVTSILSKDGGAVSSGEDGSIKSWNLLTKESSSNDKKHATPVIAFAISNDGAMIATASKDALIKINSGEGFKTSRDIDTKFAGLNKISLSSDNSCPVLICKIWGTFLLF